MTINASGDRIPDTDDNLGTLLDIVAGPFAGAFMHSREHYALQNKLIHGGGPIAGAAESGYSLGAGHAGVPWARSSRAGWRAPTA